jgi:hypothetical protein
VQAMARAKKPPAMAMKINSLMLFSPVRRQTSLLGSVEKPSDRRIKKS